MPTLWQGLAHAPGHPLREGGEQAGPAELWLGCSAGGPHRIDAHDLGQAGGQALAHGVRQVAEVGGGDLGEGALLTGLQLLDDVPVVAGLGKVGAGLAPPRLPGPAAAEGCQVGLLPTHHHPSAQLGKLRRKPGRDLRSHPAAQIVGLLGPGDGDGGSPEGSARLDAAHDAAICKQLAHQQSCPSKLA